MTADKDQLCDTHNYTEGESEVLYVVSLTNECDNYYGKTPKDERRSITTHDAMTGFWK